MTNARNGTPAFRVSPIVYWILSSVAVGVGVLVASPLLPDLWRLIVGVLNAVLTAAVARSQPTTPDDQATNTTAGKTTVPPARRPRIVRRNAERYLILPLLCVVALGCLSLQHDGPAAVPTVVASCPTGAVCDETTPGVVVADCESISDAYSAFQILVGIFGGVATASATIVPFVGDYPDATIGLSATGAGSAALGVTFGVLGLWEADRFTRWCGGQAP